MGYGNHVALDVYTIGRAKKVCSLYDSQVEQVGAAHDIHRVREMNGWKELSFTIPVKVNGETNWRAQYITNEYEVRVIDGDHVDWFRLTAPTDQDDGIRAEISVVCPHVSVVLKKRNLSLAFTDENGIGTCEYLVTTALAGSGWTLGNIDHFYETDSVIEKVRTYTCNENTGTYNMVQGICEKFTAYPVFHGDTYTVDILNRANHGRTLEMRLDKNLAKMARKRESEDIVTRMYVRGAIDDLGYVGIEE